MAAASWSKEAAMFWICVWASAQLQNEKKQLFYHKFSQKAAKQQFIILSLEQIWTFLHIHFQHYSKAFFAEQPAISQKKVVSDMDYCILY